MPGENITFTKYGEFSAGNNLLLVESLAGKTGVYTHAGKQFDLYKKVKYTKSGTLTYAEEFHDLRALRSGGQIQNSVALIKMDRLRRSKITTTSAIPATAKRSSSTTAMRLWRAKKRRFNMKRR